MPKTKFYNFFNDFYKEEIINVVKYPIYIPSKGRHTCVTAKVLEESGLNYLIVVEPQDYEQYSIYHKHDKLICLEKDNQGIPYVRNFCKEHSNAKYHWQFDDNIRSFKVRKDGKNIKEDPSKLISIIETFTNQFENIGISGFSHDIFAWTKKYPIDINKQCYSGVLINNDNGVKWRDNVVEDTDYSLQILSKEYCTLLFNTLLIAKEATKKGNGGNDNSDTWRLNRSLGLQKYWPEANFKITREYGRVKVKPSQIWKKFTHMPKGSNIDFNDNDLSEFF